MGTEVKINSKGLRDSEYDYAKAKKVYRILLLGDSYPFGWGVSGDKTFPKMIETRLNENGRHPRQYSKIEVINAGIGDYTLEQQLYFYLIEGSRYDPDMIVLCLRDRKSTRLNSSHIQKSRMPSSA